MIKNLKEFFQQQLTPDESNGTGANTRTIEYAAAILMLEISRADSNIDGSERDTVDEALTRHFHLEPEDAQTVRELAEQEVDHVISLHDFTRLLNDELEQKDKIRIVECLWKVAFADSVLDKYEEYFVRKIADLLYVSHSDYIKAKHRASGE